jgi:phenylpyruvate tautomerase PptA (4-oxalocrotonate tautomerase family)
MTVEHASGTLDAAQKKQLAEDLTRVILEIEGGADTPEGRAIAWLRFKEIDTSDWFIGGVADGSFESASGKFLIELNVPEGSMNQVRKTACHKAITAAVLKVRGVAATDEAARSIWVQIFEWQEGHLATGNRTSSLLGIAKRINLPADHPMLEFPRAYFAAKDRWYDAHGFPEHTAGRALVRY